MILLLFVLGLIVGSFLNVVILRLPVGGKLTGRSLCFKCKKTLEWKDLVPVASFIWLKGKCRYCGNKISVRYPILEIITGLLFMICGLLIEPIGVWSFELVVGLITVSLAIVVFVIDLEHFLILDKVVVVASCLLVLLLAVHDTTFNTFAWHNSKLLSGVVAAGSGVLCFGGLWLLSGGKWMGLGDVKFMAPFGLALGFPLNFVGLLLAFWSGFLVAVPLLLVGNKNMKSHIPFGTFLAFGLVATLFFGQDILSWYLGLLGFV